MFFPLAFWPFSVWHRPYNEIEIAWCSYVNPGGKLLTTVSVLLFPWKHIEKWDWKQSVRSTGMCYIFCCHPLSPLSLWVWPDAVCWPFTKQILVWVSCIAGINTTHTLTQTIKSVLDKKRTVNNDYTFDPSKVWSIRWLFIHNKSFWFTVKVLGIRVLKYRYFDILKNIF